MGFRERFSTKTTKKAAKEDNRLHFKRVNKNEVGFRARKLRRYREYLDIETRNRRQGQDREGPMNPGCLGLYGED